MLSFIFIMVRIEGREVVSLPYFPKTNLITITDLPNNAAKVDIYAYRQTKSKVGKRWVRVRIQSFISQGLTVEAVKPFFLGEEFQNDLAARTQIPARILFGFDDPLNPLLGEKS